MAQGRMVGCMMAVEACYFVLLILSSAFIIPSNSSTNIIDCGFFLTLSVNQTGEITSPNYPNDYPNSIRCIWRFQAPANHHVIITAASMTGERRAGECRDFLQEIFGNDAINGEHIGNAGASLRPYFELSPNKFRNGSRDEGILGEFCDTGFSVTSGARWLWLMFQTDSNNTFSGFRATYTTLAASTDISGVRSPITSCKWFEYLCANRECVPMSYRCDGDNDCGCSAGCDEIGCGGTGLDYITSYDSRKCEELQCREDRGGMVGIGIATGLVMFLILFCIVTVLDRKHHNMFFKKINEKISQSRRTSRTASSLSNSVIHRTHSTMGWGSRANSTVGWGSRANSTLGWSSRANTMVT